MIWPNPLISFGSPKGNRTPVSGVRGEIHNAPYNPKVTDIIDLIKDNGMLPVYSMCVFTSFSFILQLKIHGDIHGDIQDNQGPQAAPPPASFCLKYQFKGQRLSTPYGSFQDSHPTQFPSSRKASDFNIYFCSEYRKLSFWAWRGFAAGADMGDRSG
ncbi:MAG: hypothetical protein JRI85_16785 [Deltaproteobacteria bacterium]|nr:hypothetical protein [Deltaproteobacteria bacterium]